VNCNLFAVNWYGPFNQVHSRRFSDNKQLIDPRISISEVAYYSGQKASRIVEATQILLNSPSDSFSPGQWAVIEEFVSAHSEEPQS